MSDHGSPDGRLTHETTSDATTDLRFFISATDYPQSVLSNSLIPIIKLIDLELLDMPTKFGWQGATTRRETPKRVRRRLQGVFTYMGGTGEEGREGTSVRA